MTDFLTTWKRIVQDEHQAGTYWRVPNLETSRGGVAVEDANVNQAHPHPTEDNAS